MNVLVVAPHPDDETICCGGSLRAHVLDDHQVSVVFLTSGELGGGEIPREETGPVREREAEQAAAVLGIGNLDFLRFPDWRVVEQTGPAASALQSVLRTRQPDLVYVPHDSEWHPDHQIALYITRLALASLPDVMPELRCYEFWSPLAIWDVVEDITDTMTTKLQALQCYESQLRQIDYERAVIGLNQYRGTLDRNHVAFAEVFLRGTGR